MKRKAAMRTICLFLVLSLLLPFAFLETSASSFSDAIPDTSQATCVYFINLDTTRVLVNKDTNKAIAPASTVKIMTGLLAIEHFKRNFDTHITVTDTMLSDVEGTKMNLSPGDILTVRDLLYATICGGFNDAAHVLSCAVSGTSDNFVALMNKRAKELGAVETNYKNPSGWDCDGMTTTLKDTVIISKEALKNEIYMEISSATTHKITFQNQKEDFVVKNRNALISSYYAQGYTNRHAQGIIAGMTDNGGYCVVTHASIDGCSYLCVVMGASESNGQINSFVISNALIEYAKKNLGYVNVMKGGTTVCKTPIDHSLIDFSDAASEAMLNVTVADDVEIFLPYNTDVTTEITHKYYLYEERLTAPISSDTQVGNVDFYYNGELVGTFPLIVNSDIEANDFELFIVSAKSFLMSRSSLLSIVFFVIIYSIYRISSKRKSRNYILKK